MDLPIGMGIGGGTLGALALMDITQGHGLTLSEVSWKSRLSRTFDDLRS
jgi:hypothetical protein